MSNDRGFNLFCETLKKSANTIEDISTPTVLRKRTRPNYSILQYTEGNPSTTGEACYPETTVDHFKPIYMEVIKDNQGQVWATRTQSVWSGWAAASKVDKE